MPRTWREYCDDTIVWLCGCSGCRNNGRYIGEESEDWFPPATPDRYLIGQYIIQEEVGENVEGREITRETFVRVGIPENRCSDPKLIEENGPREGSEIGSDTNAVYMGRTSARSRSPIDWHEDIEI